MSKTVRVAIHFVLCGLMTALPASGAVAQSGKLKDVAFCNGVDHAPSDTQIAGCTSLIESGLENALTLMIAYNNRGNAYVSKGEHRLAIQDYIESIKLNPNSARAFNNRGVAYRKEGEFDHAIEDFSTALKLDPTYASAFANRAESYQKKGDHIRAIKDLTAAIRIEPRMKGIWNELCWNRAMSGELRQAVVDCNKSIQLEPNVAAAFDSRGVVYLKLNKF